MIFSKEDPKRYIIDVMYGDNPLTRYRIGTMTREPYENNEDILKRLDENFHLIVRYQRKEKVWNFLHFSNPYELTGKPIA